MPTDITKSLGALKDSASSLVQTIETVSLCVPQEVQEQWAGVSKLAFAKFNRTLQALCLDTELLVHDAEFQAGQETADDTCGESSASASARVYLYKASTAHGILTSLKTMYSSDTPSMGNMADLCLFPLGVAYAIDGQESDVSEPSKDMINCEVMRTLDSKTLDLTDGRSCTEGGWAELILQGSQSLISACALLKTAVSNCVVSSTGTKEVRVINQETGELDFISLTTAILLIADKKASQSFPSLLWHWKIHIICLQT